MGSTSTKRGRTSSNAQKTAKPPAKKSKGSETGTGEVRQDSPIDTTDEQQQEQLTPRKKAPSSSKSASAKGKKTALRQEQAAVEENQMDVGEEAAEQIAGKKKSSASKAMTAPKATTQKVSSRTQSDPRVLTCC
jgi:hypothetical protein